MSTTAVEAIGTLTRAAKQRALRAIENVHLAFYEKGGIRDTLATLNDQQEKVSEHIFGLAVYAAKQALNPADARELFTNMCEYAEDHYKKEHSVDNLADALPVWRVYKSNILRGVKLGLKPPEYDSEYEFRKAAMEKVRGSLPGPKAEPIERKPAAAPGPVQLDEIEQWLGSTGVHDQLRTLLAQVILSVEFIKRGSLPKAEAALRRLVDELAPSVDHRRVAA